MDSQGFFPKELKYILRFQSSNRICGKNKSRLKRNYSISRNRDYQKQSLFFDNLQNQSHYIVCDFLKISSVRGNEVLIAAEF